MNCLGGACTCGQHTRAASLLAAGGVANVWLVSVLVDAKGNELAIVPPRLIPIDLTKASAQAAEGLGNIYNAIVSFAMSHSWEGTTSVLKPHRASGKCVAGCGKESPEEWCCNFAVEFINGAHLAPEEHFLEITEYWAGVCSGMGSRCWEKSCRVIFSKVDEKYQSLGRNRPVVNTFLCARCGKTTLHEEEFKPCDKCQVTYWCSAACERKQRPKHESSCTAHSELVDAV